MILTEELLLVIVVTIVVTVLSQRIPSQNFPRFHRDRIAIYLRHVYVYYAMCTGLHLHTDESENSLF